MSRFGKLPVELPQNVVIEVDKDTFKVSGPKGALEKKLPRGVEVEVTEKSVNVVARASGKQVLSNQGTTRSHLANMVKGVSEGFSIQLELVGSGYRAEVRRRELVLNIGYSHPIVFEAPENVSFKVEKSVVTIEGIDKEVIGQLAAKIRETRKPDPYKAKGVKYINEVVRRKAGKQAAKTA